MPQVSLPVLPVLRGTDKESIQRWANDFVQQVGGSLTSIYTDITQIYNKTAVSDPAAMNNTDNEISGLTIGTIYSQAEVQALRTKCEELADDVRAIHATLTALINTLQARELV